MFSRFRALGRIIVFTGTAQIAVQAIGFVSGILIVRLLPVHEYALYTLGNSMLGAMAILGDGGVANGVMAQGGKVWQDKVKLGEVLAAGVSLQKRQVVLSLLIVLPILFYLLHRQDASWPLSALLALSLIPAFALTLVNSLLQIPVKLHQDIRPLQRYQIESNVVRLGLSVVLVFFFPFAVPAILCAGISQFWNNHRLSQRSTIYFHHTRHGNPTARRAIAAMVRRTMPLSIFYMITGQVSIWLLSIFSTNASVAQLGAISRFYAVLMLINTIYSIVFIPRFSRLDSVDNGLLGKYFMAHLSLMAILAATMTLSWGFGGIALSVLGPEYESLGGEFFLAMTGAMLPIMTDISFAINSGRGWVFSPLLYIPLMLALLLFLISVLAFKTLIGVLLITLFIEVALISLACFTALFS